VPSTIKPFVYETEEIACRYSAYSAFYRRTDFGRAINSHRQVLVPVNCVHQGPGYLAVDFGGSVQIDRVACDQFGPTVRELNPVFWSRGSNCNIDRVESPAMPKCL